MYDRYLGDGLNHFLCLPLFRENSNFDSYFFNCALSVVVFGSQFRDASWKGMIGSCILYST